ncbi:MAG: hypothetical protein LBC20_11985, partial [Planctomycetaceae bacterium]|nr:hypothetical protein [Planctomycetaceae bacterium]
VINEANITNNVSNNTNRTKDFFMMTSLGVRDKTPAFQISGNIVLFGLFGIVYRLRLLRK